MPLATIQDWVNGPMGPGFFLLFRKNIDFFYDGGPMDALLGNDDTIKKKEHELNISVATTLLMMD